jgi:hypothetical protein
MLAVWGATAIWDVPLTPAGNVTLSEALSGLWIKMAWNDISLKSFSRVFRRCCMSNDVNGTKVMSCGMKIMKNSLPVMKMLVMTT